MTIPKKCQTLERALRESEELFNATFETGAVGICHCGLDGHFLRVNQKFCEIVGYNRSELLARTFEDITHPEDLNADVDKARQLVRGEIENYSQKKRYLRKDGSIVWVFMTAELVRDRAREPRYVNGVICDLTNFKDREKLCQGSGGASDRQATAAPQENYNLLRAVIESTPDAIFVKDIQGRYVMVNSTSASIFGREVADIIGKDDTELLPPEIARTVMETDRKIMTVGETQIVEEIVPTRGIWRMYLSTKSLWRDSQGNVIGLIGIARDITDRKHTEEKLREKTEEMQAIFQAFPDMFFRIASDGTILDYKANFTSDLYVPSSEFLGKRMQEILPTPVGRKIDEAISQVVQTNSLVGIEYSLPMSNVEEHYEARLVPLQKEQVIAIVRNISDRKQVETQLRLTRERLQYLLSSSPAVIYSAKVSDDYGATFISENAAAVLGYEAEEFLADSGLWARNIHPEDAPHVFANLAQIFELGHQVLEYRFQHKNGTYLWMHDEIKPIADEAGNPLEIVGYWADITEQKQAQQALRESEEFSRATFEQAAVGIAYGEMEGGFLRINQKFCDIVGYTNEEMLALTFQEITHPDDLEADLTYLRQLFAGEILNYSMEKRYIHKDGSPVWINLTVSLLRERSGEPKYWMGVIEDIGDRKRASEALLQQAQIIDQVHDSVICTDMDNYVTSWNKGAERIFGYTAPEAIGKHVTFIYPPDRKEVLQQVMKPLLEKETHEVEVQYRRKSGEDFYALVGLSLLRDSTQTAIGIIGFTMDIHYRKMAEIALQRSEAELREKAQREELLYQLANQIRNSLDLDTILETAVFEIRNLLLLDICQFLWYVPQPTPAWDCVKEARNPDVPSRLGYYPTEKNDPLTQKILNLELIRLDYIAAATDSAVQQFYTDTGYTAALFLPLGIRNGDIGVVCCGQFNEPRYWKDSEVELLQAVCDQLAIAISQAELYNSATQSAALAKEKASELELTLHELRSTQTQLIQSEKMSSLGQMVAGVAHEINNPVSFIYGNVTHAREYASELLHLLELYQHHYPNPVPEIQQAAVDIDLEFLLEDFPKLLDSMKMGTSRITEIVKSLRSFSRLDEAEMKKVDIHEGIQSTLLILQNRLKAKPDRPEIEVVQEYGQLPLVMCYAGQLNQVFMNLLANAIDAIEDSYKTRTPEEIRLNHGTIWISTEIIESDRVVIKIKDNGIGIPEELQRRLFDPFFTTKPVGKGTGLGLSICYQIVVEKHRGQLHYISQPGQGTEFTIAIPIKQN